MRGKIDLEGHFATQDTVGDSERYFDKDDSLSLEETLRLDHLSHLKTP